MEIERQFLVAFLPVLPREYESIRQGYVSFLPEIRIREIDGERHILTVKRGVGLVREEWETDITKAEFDNLAARLYPGTSMIEKRRYRIALANGRTAELHAHDGHLAGFSYVEVEFPAKEIADTFQPPPWVGREETDQVTEDARFSYMALAQGNAAETVKQLLGHSR